jgi:DNA-binding response OmpR family regulator
MKEKVPRILIVDDERPFCDLLRMTLVPEGYAVAVAASGETALAMARQTEYDLALVDLMLGAGINGIQVMQKLREITPDITVIVLTAHASLDTAVQALRQGAHDYLYKPCRLEQLRDSVRKGLLKRRREEQRKKAIDVLERSLRESLEVLRGETPLFDTTPAARDERFLRQGDLVIDRHRRLATMQGDLLPLTTAEFDVLLYLAEQAPRVIAARELAEQALHYQCSDQEAKSIIRWHIYRLRQKLEPTPAAPRHIKNVRGQGYFFSV